MRARLILEVSLGFSIIYLKLYLTLVVTTEVVLDDRAMLRVIFFNLKKDVQVTLLF